MQYRSLIEYYRSFDHEILLREVWHTHRPRHIDRMLFHVWYPDRAIRFLGIVGTIYGSPSLDNKYAHKWLPLPNDPEVFQNYLKVFDDFNCFATLNCYSREYGIGKAELKQAKDLLAFIKTRHFSVEEKEIWLQEEKIKDIESSIPKSSYMDLAFDFDVGEAKEIKTIDEAVPFVLKLIQWLEKHNASHHIYFSGRKGFHVVVPYEVFEQPMADNNDKINKQIARFIEAETGDLHIDWSIFSNRKQFRLPNSLHPSGFWKVSLLPEELEKGEWYIKKQARRKRPIPDIPTTYSQRLAEFRYHAENNENARPKYKVSKNNIKKFQAYKQSQRTAAGTYRAVQGIDKLTNPPCVTHALQKGVVSPKANRNGVTMFLATYYANIGRSQHEITQHLTHHALVTLKQFSLSDDRTIELSTESAVKAVYDYHYSFNCGFARRLGYNCTPTCEIYRQYRSQAHYQKLLSFPTKLETVEPDSDDMFETVDDLRKALVTKMDDYVNDIIKNNRKRNIKPLVIKAPAGSGKTVTTYKWIDGKKLRCLWVGSRLDLFSNIPESQRKNWIQILGRIKGGEDERTGIELQRTCHKYKLAKILHDKRLNTQYHLCQHCEFNKESKEMCLYYQQFEDTTKNWFVQQPTFLHKAKDMLPKFDILVFDEDTLQNFIEFVKITAGDVKTVMDLVADYLRDTVSCDADVPIGAVKPLLLLHILLDTIKTLLDDPDMAYPMTGNTFYNHLQLKYELCQKKPFYDEYEYYRYLIPREICFLPEEIDTNRRDFVNSIYLAVENDSSNLPLSFTKELIDIKDDEYHYRDLRSHISRLSLIRDKGENKILLNYKLKAPIKSKPTIILDATARQDIYEALFEHQVKFYKPQLPINNEFWQCYSTNGSWQSFQNDDYKKRMFMALEVLLKMENDALIICKESLEKKIKIFFSLSSKTQITHYYATRGSNEFEAARQVILLGAPGFAEDTIKQYAAALYPHEKLSAKTHFVKRQYEGTNSGVWVMEYVDPRMQAIQEVSREHEMYQSLSRIRFILDKVKWLTSLTNIPLPGIPVTKLFSLNELIGDRMPKKESDLRVAIRDVMIEKLGGKGYVIPKNDILPLFPNKARRTLEFNISKVAEDEKLTSSFFNTDSQGGWKQKIYYDPAIALSDLIKRLKSNLDIDDIVLISNKQWR